MIGIKKLLLEKILLFGAEARCKKNVVIVFKSLLEMLKCYVAFFHLFKSLFVGREEVFNRVYSSIRNVIERSFGV